MIAASAILPYIPQLLKFGVGAMQSIGGIGGAMSNQRPQFEIPQAAKQALSLANMRANSNMPNYNASVQNAQLATANQLSAAREAGNPLSVLPQLQANENAAMRGIEGQNMQYNDQAVQQQQQHLQRQADYQEQQFQMNEFAPYADKQNRANQLIGSGISNITGALDSAASTMIMDKLLQGQKETNNWYDQVGNGLRLDSATSKLSLNGQSLASGYQMQNPLRPQLLDMSYPSGVPLNQSTQGFMPRFGN